MTSHEDRSDTDPTAERLGQAFGMIEFGFQLEETGLRAREPELTGLAFEQRLAVQRFGPELEEKVAPALAERAERMAGEGKSLFNRHPAFFCFYELGAGRRLMLESRRGNGKGRSPATIASSFEENARSHSAFGIDRDSPDRAAHGVYPKCTGPTTATADSQTAGI